jgi:hypothetical protein
VHGGGGGNSFDGKSSNYFCNYLVELTVKDGIIVSFSGFFVPLSASNYEREVRESGKGSPPI